MQSDRDILQYLYTHTSQDRNVLRNMSRMPPSTFRRNMTILENGGSLVRSTGSGRPTIFDSRDRQRISSFALRNPMDPARSIRQKFEQTSSKSASTRTYQRTLKKSGILSVLPRSVPDITTVHEQKRKDFADTWKNYDFNDIFMTDESLFQLHRNKIKVWSSSRAPRPTKAIPKFSPKIMVWGAISFRGFYLKIVDGNGTINGQKYCHIVDEFKDYANTLYPNGWIIEQDGATPHTARETLKFFQDTNIQYLQWPPNSPDLTPIENVWQVLKNSVERKNPRNVQELRQYILESQHEITPEMRSNLMNSIQKRLEVCSARGGKLI